MTNKTKEFNLGKETITLNEEMNGINGEFYDIKDVKKFIKILKDELRNNEFETDDYKSSDEIIDKLAGDKLI